MDFGHLDSRSFRNDDYRDKKSTSEVQRYTVNLAPLKGILESDPVRSKVLKLLVEDSGWVTTADLLKEARQIRPILGAVTIGTILNGLNELVATRLVLSRTSLTSGLDWAEWRINPDWITPIRKLLQMLSVRKHRGSGT
ncbi:MAG: hypothetical protein PVG65_06580 [Candidatus Thorarchaeota archaeon]|jgi:hypothetical protein